MVDPSLRRNITFTEEVLPCLVELEGSFSGTMYLMSAAIALFNELPAEEQKRRVRVAYEAHQRRKKQQ